MSMMTSVIRSDDDFRYQHSVSEPDLDATQPGSAIDNMRSCLRYFSDAEMATLEDELDFYTFTGISGTNVKKLLSAI